MTWSVIYLLLWLYRCAFSVLAETAIASLTSLGDTGQYTDVKVDRNVVEAVTNSIANPREAATALTEALGSGLTQISGGLPFFTSICFQTIAFLGILSLLRASPPRLRMILLVFVMMPSFSIWSSVASKEALGVWAIGLLSALAVRMYSGAYKVTVWHVIAFIFIALSKEQYIPALIFLLAGTFCARHVRQHASLILWAGMLSFAMLYLFQDKVVEVALEIPQHFENMGSSRETFWAEPSEVFTKAPLGMFLAFFGPTLSEMQNGPLQAITAAESTIMVMVIALILLTRLPQMPVYAAMVGGFTLFWIMFAAYPTGVMNAGSAIRYRTNYLLLIFAVIVIIMSRSTYTRWLEWRNRGLLPKAVVSPPANMPPVPSEVGGGNATV